MNMTRDNDALPGWVRLAVDDVLEPAQEAVRALRCLTALLDQMPAGCAGLNLVSAEDLSALLHILAERLDGAMQDAGVQLDPPDEELPA